MAAVPTTTPQGNAVAINAGTSQDYPRLVASLPYFAPVAIAEIIEPSVQEAVEGMLPSLVPPYVDAAAAAAVQSLAVLLNGSTMTGPLYLSPLMPTAASQAATKSYVDSMVATAGVPEVPPTPVGQSWARQTGQWVPITPQTGVFLPLSGGTMQGIINMGGNAITNLPAVPSGPSAATPMQWVLNQIAAQSLYQGTWNMDTYTPNLTLPQYQQNNYSFVAITTSPTGVVIAPAIPGLQGTTVYNGDQVIWSNAAGRFQSIHAGGLTLAEADARYLQLAGGQMSGSLLLHANAAQPTEAVTLQQMQAAVSTAGIGEAPNDGQLYGRNGATNHWSPVLPLAGGIMTGPITLSGNATTALNPTSLQQMNSAISAATAPLLPLAGGTMTGLLTLSGNAANPLNAVPLQQLNAMLNIYVPLAGGTMTGALTVNQNAATPAGLAGALTVIGANTANSVINLASFAGNAQFNFASAEGTGAAPTATTLNRAIGFVNFNGYNGSGYIVGATFYALAAENWTATANGATFVWGNNTPGTVNHLTRMTLGQGLVLRDGSGNPPPGNDLGPGSINAAGTIFSQNNGVVSGGNNGSFLFADRNGTGPNWFWYANGSVARLNNSSGDLLTVNSTTGGVLSSGEIRSSTGYGCRQGTPGPGNSNDYNIDWQPGAHLWIDNVNQGMIAFQSDYRIKENVAALGSKWDEVKALRPISYTTKENVELLSVTDPAERWGFIAHELQETLIPAAATGHKDAENLVQSPNPWVMLAAVVSALQEAMERIETLEATIH